MTHINRHGVGLLLVLLVAFGLRVMWLNASEIGGDEAFSYALMRLSWAEIVRTTFVLQEPHPVGSYFLQNIVITLMGDSEFGIRFSSVVFGTLAVALMAPFVRQLRIVRNAKSPVLASVATALMALHPLAVLHSRWARMYAISLALTLASTTLMLALLHKTSVKRWLGYVVVTWLALNVHYFAGYVIVAQNVFMLAMLLRSGKLRRTATIPWLTAQVVTALLFAPWFWATRDIIINYSGTGFSPSWQQFLGDAAQVLALGESPIAWRWLFIVGFLMLAVLGFVRALSNGVSARNAALMLGIYLATPLLLIFLGSRNKATFLARYLTPALPPLLVLVAGALAGALVFIPKKLARLGGGALALFVLVGNGLALQHYFALELNRSPDWRNLLAVFDRYQGSLPVRQSRVAVSFPDPAISYYLRNQQAAVVMPTRYADAASAEQAADELAQAGVRRVVLQIVDGGYNGAGLAQRALARRFTKIEEWYSGRWIVQVFARIDAAELLPQPATFSNGAQLAAAHVHPDPRGRLIEVHVRWRRRANPPPLAGSEKLFIHVMDVNTPWQLSGQLDLPLTEAMFDGTVQSYGIRLPEQFAASQYRISLGIYDPAQPNAPRLLTSDGRDFVELATVTLAESAATLR